MTACSFTDRAGCTWRRVTAATASKAYSAGHDVMTAPAGYNPASPWGCGCIIPAGDTWQRQRLYADASARSSGQRYAAWYVRDITPADTLRITADALYSMAAH